VTIRHNGVGSCKINAGGTCSKAGVREEQNLCLSQELKRISKVVQSVVTTLSELFTSPFLNLELVNALIFFEPNYIKNHVSCAVNLWS
jgi:hypothetical protein